MNATEVERNIPSNNLKQSIFQEIGILSPVIEDILEDFDNSAHEPCINNKTIALLTIENMKKLIDYSTKMPVDDSHSIGFKYPYNATELLCSQNISIQRLLIHEEEIMNTTENIHKQEEEEEQKALIKHKIRYDLIDYLFSFFNQDLNDHHSVLIGYFNKIFNIILCLLGHKLIAYLFTETPEVINHLIINMNFRGIADCLEKIMTYQSDETENEPSSLIYQQRLYEMILNQMLNQNEEQIETICETLKVSLINSSAFPLMMSSKNLIDTLFNVLSKSTLYPSNYRNILSVVIELIERSTKLFSKQITSKHPKKLNLNAYMVDDENQIDSKVNIENLEPLMAKLNETITDVIIDLASPSKSYFSINHHYSLKTLGVTKVIESEYIKSVLELTITSIANSCYAEIGIHLIEKIINQKALMILTYYYFEYPNHSIFICVYIDILTIIMNESSPPQLIKHLILESNLISKTIESLITERKKIHFKAKKYTNNCIFANGIGILDLIFKSKNEFVFSLLKEKKDYLAFNEIFISNIIKLFNQKLCVTDSDLLNFFSCQNNRTDLSQIHLQSISFEELFEISLMIYSAYKQDADYKLLIMLLDKEMRVENDAAKSFCVSEYLDDNDGSSLRSNPFEYNDESSSSSCDELDDSIYYDNNFWQSSSYSQLDDSSLSNLSDLL